MHTGTLFKSESNVPELVVYLVRDGPEAPPRQRTNRLHNFLSLDSVF